MMTLEFSMMKAIMESTFNAPVTVSLFSPGVGLRIAPQKYQRFC
jgi:hypothetical protein